MIRQNLQFNIRTIYLSDLFKYMYVIDRGNCRVSNSFISYLYLSQCLKYASPIRFGWLLNLMLDTNAISHVYIARSDARTHSFVQSGVCVCACPCLCVCLCVFYALCIRLVYLHFKWIMCSLCVRLFLFLSLLCCRHLHYNFIYKLNYAINYHGCLFFLLLSLHLHLILFRFQLAISNSYNNISLHTHLFPRLGLQLATYAKCDEYLICLCMRVCECVCVSSVRVCVCVYWVWCIQISSGCQTNPMKSECNQPMIVIIVARQTGFELYVWEGRGFGGQLTKQQWNERPKLFTYSLTYFFTHDY